MLGEKREETRAKREKRQRSRNERVQLKRSHFPSTLDSETSGQPVHKLSDVRVRLVKRGSFTFDQIILPLVRSLTVTTSLPSVESLLSSSRTITSQLEGKGEREEGEEINGVGEERELTFLIDTRACSQSSAGTDQSQGSSEVSSEV